MIVVFDPAKFREMYPGAFPEADYSDLYLQSCFNRAAGQVSNAANSPIPVEPREMILYSTTAHIATLGKRDANIVGQVVSAGQGSTSVSVAAPAEVGSAAWWMQTLYGQEAWAMTKPYRSLVWVSP